MPPARAFEPEPLHDQTAFRRDLLVAVYANPGTKGLAIKDVLDQYYGSEVNHGRLYPNLQKLADQGLIAKGSYDERTNTYELTRRGERELAAHLAWFDQYAGDLLD